MRVFLLSLTLLLAAAPAGAGETKISIGVPGFPGRLGGILISAPAGAPAVVIVPGSGPTDRDGNGPAGLKTDAYKLLALGLGRRGIATIRTDKRGMFSSAAKGFSANNVKVADYVADIRAWTRQAALVTGAPCAWILGHSEGGLMALAAAQGAPGSICGLILVATPGRPLGTILREQLANNPANRLILDGANRAITAIEAGRRPELAWHDFTLKRLFREEVLDFLIDLFARDPAKMIGNVAVPVLIVQGTRDIQIQVADARALKAARPQAELRLIRNATHTLKIAETGDRAANVATYTDPSLPLADGIVAAVADFVRKHQPAAAR